MAERCNIRPILPTRRANRRIVIPAAGCYCVPASSVAAVRGLASSAGVVTPSDTKIGIISSFPTARHKNRICIPVFLRPSARIV